MKILKYKVEGYMNRYDPETDSFVQKSSLSEVEAEYNDENLVIAQQTAYHGEYTIEDDGQPDPEVPETDTAVWDELDAAYQEGVDSV